MTGPIPDLGDVVKGIESINSLAKSEEVVGKSLSSLEDEASLLKAIDHDAEVVSSNAKDMMSPYVGKLTKELPPEENSAFQLDLEGIDREINVETEKFHRSLGKKPGAIEKVAGGEEAKSPVDENKEEVEKIPIEKISIQLENGRWVNMAELNSDTQGFVNEMGFDPEFSSPFTPEQEARFEELFRRFFYYREGGQYGAGAGGVPPESGGRPGMGFANQPGKGGPEIKIAPSEAAKAAEDEDARELMKLLLRIAVKVGTRAAAILARNIAKTQMRDNPELAIALGMFGDLTVEAGNLTDTLIAGKKGGSVGEAIYKHFNKGRSEENNAEKGSAETKDTDEKYTNPQEFF